MKFILLAMLAVLSTSAFAAQNWFSSAARIECKSTFEHKARSIVKTTKVDHKSDGEFSYVSGHEISSVVQVGRKDVSRKYAVSKVMVDAIYNKQPTVVSGKNVKTGEKIKIEIEANGQSLDFAPAEISIGGKVQDYLKLECRVIFVG